jgi:hypothetical protein
MPLIWTISSQQTINNMINHTVNYVQISFHAKATTYINGSKAKPARQRSVSSLGRLAFTIFLIDHLSNSDKLFSSQVEEHHQVVPFRYVVITV